MKKPVVAIIMGSDSDLPVMQQASDVLKEFKVPHEVRILSAHRLPKETATFAEGAQRRGFEVIIAAAGGAAHLAGVVAAHTTLPVIGVPIETKSLKGVDSLFATVQMPPGVPVATMAIGGAKNAALFALQILAVKDGKMAVKLSRYKKGMAKGVRLKDQKVGFRFPR